MNLEYLREYCLKKPGVEESLPFGQETLVFKVMGKLFLLTNLESFGSVNLKCTPELATELRERYPAVKPGYHMNKKHWNTILIDGSINDEKILDWVDLSYRLVVDNLPKKLQIELR